jgi:hypothetical protein
MSGPNQEKAQEEESLGGVTLVAALNHAQVESS